jgi:hypothetical protein
MTSRRAITRWTQPLACLLFVAGILCSLQYFPGPFDWRRKVISTLLSPRDNPEGYLWVAAGMALSGLLVLPLGRYFHGVLRQRAPLGARTVRGLLMIGGSGMVLIAAFAHVPPALPRLHDFLALLTYCTLLPALLVIASLLVRHPEMTHLRPRHRRWVLPMLLIVVLLPIVATLWTQASVYHSHGYAPAFHDGTLPDWLNIAFWEWILSALFYAGAWMAAWLTGPRSCP